MKGSLSKYIEGELVTIEIEESTLSEFIAVSKAFFAGENKCDSELRSGDYTVDPKLNNAPNTTPFYYGDIYNTNKG